MEKQGFAVNPDEWWHFDYKDWRKYGVQDVLFEEMK
jgi:D-alanyl-D-alanine dipeptidase